MARQFCKVTKVYFAWLIFLQMFLFICSCQSQNEKNAGASPPSTKFKMIKQSTGTQTDRKVISTYVLPKPPATTANQKKPVNLLFRSKQEFVKRFPDFKAEYKNLCPWKPDKEDFSKHMVLFLQDTANKVFSIAPKVKKISVQGEMLIVTWYMEEQVTGTIRQDQLRREQTVAAIVVIKQININKVKFNYRGCLTPFRNPPTPGNPPPLN